MSIKTIITLLATLIFVAACSQMEPSPTATPAQSIAETAVATDLPPTPETNSAEVTHYNLGDATIIQDHFPEDSRFRNMPVRLEGVIGVPASEEPSPVVLIMHGSHVICPDDVWPCSPEEEQKNYEGYAYLVEALAEAGYVALSINVNAEHTFGYGEGTPTVRTTQLIDLHLGELAAANAEESDKFGMDLNGRVDLTRMTWIGHSRGADFANQIVREENLATSASSVGYGPVAGLIFVAPPVLSIDTLPTVDLPFTVILPACDGDVNTLNGQLLYESARLAEGRTDFATSIYLEGANHNYFNAILEAEQPDPLANRPDCTVEKLLTAEAQQDFLTQYTLDFLQKLDGTSDQSEVAAERLGLVADTPISPTYHDYEVLSNILMAPNDRLAITTPQSEAELSQNLLGGAVALNEVTAQFCPDGYYVPDMEPGSEPCQRVHFNQPGYPQQFVVSWETSGAEWRTAVPETHKDLTDYAGIQIRAALDPLSPLNQPGEPQSFTIEFVDSAGNREQVVVPSVAFPIGETKPNEHFEGDFFTGNVYMSSLRIPLASLTAVDLANITEIALVFDQTPSGTLFLADLELVK